MIPLTKLTKWLLSDCNVTESRMHWIFMNSLTSSANSSLFIWHNMEGGLFTNIEKRRVENIAPWGTADEGTMICDLTPSSRLTHCCLFAK